MLKGFQWAFRAVYMKSGKNLKIAYPLVIGGTGKIKLGNNVQIGHHAELTVNKKAHLAIGNNASIDKNVTIKVVEEGNLIAGDFFSVEQGSRIFLRNDWTFGNKIRISTNCQIFSRERGFYGKLTIGDGTHVGDGTIIDVSDDIQIGEDVAIGPNCTMYTHDHNYREAGVAAPWHGKPVAHPISIGNGAWIGSNVTILPGVHIGECAIVAAGAVVAKSVAAYAMAGGVPAKIIKSDFRD